MEELDNIIKMYETWPQRIDQAIACAYQDSGHGGKNYVRLKHEYVQYMLDKMIEEKTAEFIR